MEKCAKFVKMILIHRANETATDMTIYIYYICICIYIMYIHTCVNMYIICAVVCAIYSVIIRSRCDNILHVRVCTVNARKLDYKGHSWLWIRTNGRFVSSVMTRELWFAYHDDEDDDWMNRFALTNFFFLSPRLPPNWKSQRDFPGSEIGIVAIANWWCRASRCGKNCLRIAKLHYT